MKTCISIIFNAKIVSQSIIALKCFCHRYSLFSRICVFYVLFVTCLLLQFGIFLSSCPANDTCGYKAKVYVCNVDYLILKKQFVGLSVATYHMFGGLVEELASLWCFEVSNDPSGHMTQNIRICHK